MDKTVSHVTSVPLNWDLEHKLKREREGKKRMKKLIVFCAICALGLFALGIYATYHCKAAKTPVEWGQD